MVRALLYGSGAVGIGIAASLFDSGWEVDLIAPPKTREMILERGIKRIGIFKTVQVPGEKVRVFERLSCIAESGYDYILICTKALCNEENALDICHNQHLLREGGKIVIFQNGWGTDEPYLKYFDKSQVYNARVITGFSRPEANISEVTVHASPILIGSLHHQPVHALEPLAKAIDQGGIPCEADVEIEKALWAKMLYNCTLNPLGAVLNVNYGKLTECVNSVFIMDRLIEEIFAVMQAAGYQTYWNTAEEYKETFYGQLIPTTYNHRSSTLQDIEKRNRTEINTLNGSVVQLGERMGVPVPYNTMLLNLIRTMESYF